MSTFPDWQKHAVTQKHLNTGCIPTAYETMLKSKGAAEIDFANFQEEFDLERKGIEGNHFVNVAAAIQKKYPDVEFPCEPFATGAEKLARVEEMIANGEQVLVSITNEPEHGPGNGWHIMPIVDSDDDSLTLLVYMPDTRVPVTKKISKKDFVDYHDNYGGGKEISYIKKWKKDKPSTP